MSEAEIQEIRKYVMDNMGNNTQVAELILKLIREYKDIKHAKESRAQLKQLFSTE